MDQNDPRATFNADQAEAANQAADRDQYAWDARVASTEADLELKAAHRNLELAHAARVAAWKDTITTVNAALIFLTAAGVAVAVVKAAEYVLGWFR